MTTKTPKLWTKKGLERLGNLIKASRETLRMSQRALAVYIEEQTGHCISFTNLSALERGNHQLSWNTLAILAAAEFACKPNGVPFTVEELCEIASENLLLDNPTVLNSDKNHGTKEHVLLKEEAMYQFSYFPFQRLKALMDASRAELDISEVQFVRAAESNGIDADEALLFYEDVQDGTLRSHPVSRIEAFLPLLFRIKKWNPLTLNKKKTYAGDFQGLLQDLEAFNNSGIHQQI